MQIDRIVSDCYKDQLLQCLKRQDPKRGTPTVQF